MKKVIYYVIIATKTEPAYKLRVQGDMIGFNQIKPPDIATMKITKYIY